VILAGNGVIRQGAADELVRFAEMLRIPVANSFMAKGVVPFSSEFSLGTIGSRRVICRGMRSNKPMCPLRRLRHGRVPPRHVESR
jgi:thiamine pyrophosphate-dependent acetolactate synthase large subunit-like protein